MARSQVVRTLAPVTITWPQCFSVASLAEVLLGPTCELIDPNSDFSDQVPGGFRARRISH